MPPPPQSILVTGGAGFIGSHLVRLLLVETDAAVVNLDALTYAGSMRNLRDVGDNPRHRFVHGDIRDAELLAATLTQHRVDAVFHLAAESHVDRSIDSPRRFIETNVLGTGALLGSCLSYWEELPAGRRDAFRLVHVSTDEVFGALRPGDPPFTEESPYLPSSPYAATKAASDHLVRSYRRTYGLPAMVTNSSNNYGPNQFPEKLIPQMILRALAGEPLPLYGDGLQERDWLHVTDQCRGLLSVLKRGVPGRSYLFGAGRERTNLEVVRAIADAVDAASGRPAGTAAKRIVHVADRPGHDRRYAIDAGRAREELGWSPSVGPDEGIAQAVAWYAGSSEWVEAAGRQTERLGLR